MHRLHPFLFRAVIFVSATLLINSTGAAQTTDASKIQDWVTQLGSRKYQERESASASLLQTGRTAIPQLEQAAASEYLEISVRAFGVLSALLDSDDKLTFRDAFAALKRLSESDEANIANEATRRLQPDPELVEWIKGLGGEFDVDEQNRIIALRLDRHRVIDPGFHMDQLTDEELVNLKQLRWLKSLTLEGRPRITDECLQYLSGLRKLEILNLRSTRITGAGFSELSKLPNLVELNLSYCPIDEQQLAVVAKFPALRKLNLRPAVGNHQSDLSWWMNLRAPGYLLHIEDCRGGIGDLGLKHLGTATGLTSLTLSKTRITDKGMQDLASQTNLEELDLSRTAITDQGLKKLTGLSNLKTLRLNFVPITDDGVESLANLKNLRHLELAGTQVGRALKAFRDSMMENLDLTMTGLNNELMLELTKLPRLRRLKFEKTDVSLECLSQLASQFGQLGLNELMVGRGWATQNDQGKLVSMDLSGIDLKQPDFEMIGGHVELQRLKLARTNLQDTDLQNLSQLTKLIELSVVDTRLTDDCFEHLRDMKSLNRIPCQGTKISFSGLVDYLVTQRQGSLENVIRDLGGRIEDGNEPGLNRYRLPNLGLRDDDLKLIASLPKLGSVLLNGNPLSDEGLLHLEGHSELTGLWLSGTGFTEVGLEHLSKLDNLQTLWLTDAVIGSMVLSPLTKLKRLNSLNLCGNRIDDDALQHLSMIQSLRLLIVDRGALSKDAIEELNQQNPELEVVESQKKALASVRGHERTTSSFPQGGNRRKEQGCVLTRVDKRFDRSKFSDVYFEEAHSLNAYLLHVPAQFEAILDLPTLTQVSIMDLELLDRQVELLCQLPKLKQLSFYRSLLPTESLAHLANAPLVETLDLQRTNVSADACRYAAKLPNLKVLRLGGYQTKISGDAFQALAELKNLEELQLSRTGLVDADLKCLTGLSKLKRLSMREVRVGSGLAHLSGLDELVDVDLSYTFADDSTLEVLAGLKRLKRLTLTSTYVTKNGLESFRQRRPDVNVFCSSTIQPEELVQIGELRRVNAIARFDDSGLVTSVDLRRCQNVDNAVFASLSFLEKLRKIQLGEIATDEIVTRLAQQHPQLVELNLTNSRVTNGLIERLEALKSLQVLWIGGTQVTPEVVRSLVKIKGLQKLSLQNIPIADEHVQRLTGFQFQTLNLSGTKITDAACSQISNIQSLTTLSLNNTDIGDNGLEELSKLGELRYLSIKNTQISHKAVNDFKRRLPKQQLSNISVIH